MGAAAGLLANDTDADGDALQVLSFEAPANGSLNVVTDGSFTYTPNAGFVGTEVLTYTVSDGITTVSGEFTINVESTVQTERIGDAPARVTSSTQFATAWSDPLLHGIRHTDDADAAAPTWTAVQFNTLNSAVLSGGDIYNGDLGVSGQVAATSSVRQEIDGTEALRFDLAAQANSVTVDLSRFFASDDGSMHFEAGRLRLLDSSGNVVAETGFVADSTTGSKTVTLDAAAGFSTIELSAGA
ncbi:MAG: Ig-like domain-containing protein, partial [Thauera sp.]